jgi:molybdate transport system substrate-binding protein
MATRAFQRFFPRNKTVPAQRPFFAAFSSAQAGGDRAGGRRGALRHVPLAALSVLLVALAGCTQSSVPESRVSAALPPQAAGPTGQEVVLLFAAASAGPVIDELRVQFEKSHPKIKVRTSYAATSALAYQISEGAEADLFLSANQKWADFLAEKGYVAAQQPLLGNRLVVAVLADSAIQIEEPADLLAPEIERLALADTDAVPAGMYGKQALKKLGLWEGVRSKVTAAGDVQQALAYVETGAAQAAIVYATDAAPSRAVRVACRLDPGLSEPIHYPLALLQHGAGRPAACELRDFLQSPQAADIFRRHGFTVLPAAESEAGEE